MQNQGQWQPIIDNTDEEAVAMAVATPVWIVTAHRAPPLRCSLSDVSPTGGCLSIDPQMEVPDRFALYTSFRNSRGRACHVVWRKERLIGFEFIATAREEGRRKLNRY